MSDLIPVFDGHNDALLKMDMQTEGDPVADFLSGMKGHVDLPKATAGGFAGGFFAAFVPPSGPPPGPTRPAPNGEAGLPPQVGMEEARTVTIRQIALLKRLERESAGRVRVCHSAADIRAARAAGAIAAIMHIEGVEAIDADLDFLEVLYAAGLRSLGPVWSRQNIFATGVPFRFPAGPDIGPGLTDAGRALVRACDRMGIVVDLSHLNEAGFWDVAEVSQAPLVATHSNVHALCASPRNLTDRQLDAIRERQGIVGVNFGAFVLRADGQHNRVTELDVVVDHIAALIERVGEGGVAFGSDFDGAIIPEGIGDAAGLPRLIEAMRARGFDEALIARIAYGNWVDLLERVIG